MFEENKNNIVDTIKTLIYSENQDLFNIIDFDDDYIYLDPMIFAYFNSDDISKSELPLKQVLYSYMKYEIQRQGVKVNSDKKGNIYIPNLGDFHTEVPRQKIILKKRNQDYVLEINNKSINFCYTPSRIVPNFDVEILESNNILLEKSFIDSSMNIIYNLNIKQTTDKYLNHLYKAFDFIKRECPKVADNIFKSVRKVIIFNSEKLNSFASFSFHGLAFLNANSLDLDEVFFIDDISHQCGHIYFNIETYDKETYFNINPSSTILSLESTFKSDKRSIYVLLHALFTYTQILATLNSYWDIKYGSQRQLREAVGRICFYLSKFERDIECFSRVTKYNSKNTILTKKGEELFKNFRDTFLMYKNKWGKYCKKVNLTGQPYNFNYKIFESNNANITL